MLVSDLNVFQRYFAEKLQVVIVTYKMTTSRYVQALIEHVRHTNILTLLRSKALYLLVPVPLPRGASLLGVEG